MCVCMCLFVCAVNVCRDQVMDVYVSTRLWMYMYVCVCMCVCACPPQNSGTTTRLVQITDDTERIHDVHTCICTNIHTNTNGILSQYYKDWDHAYCTYIRINVHADSNGIIRQKHILGQYMMYIYIRIY
jgi:hypothetical protein